MSYKVIKSQVYKVREAAEVVLLSTCDFLLSTGKTGVLPC